MLKRANEVQMHRSKIVANEVEMRRLRGANEVEMGRLRGANEVEVGKWIKSRMEFKCGKDVHTNEFQMNK